MLFTTNNFCSDYMKVYIKHITMCCHLVGNYSMYTPCLYMLKFHCQPFLIETLLLLLNLSPQNFLVLLADWIISSSTYGLPVACLSFVTFLFSLIWTLGTSVTLSILVAPEVLHLMHNSFLYIKCTWFLIKIYLFTELK